MRPLPPRGNDHVDVLAHGDEMADGGAIGGVDDPHDGFRQARGGLEALRTQAAMARLLRIASDPPRRMAALPDFRHSAAASAVTFGRAFVDDADDAQRHARIFPTWMPEGR